MKRMPTDSMFDTLKEWLAAGNPGLVTREDLARVESRLDELLELMDEIESRLMDDGEPPRPTSNGRDEDH
jgi:hypothetical protein